MKNANKVRWQCKRLPLKIENSNYIGHYKPVQLKILLKINV